MSMTQVAEGTRTARKLHECIWCEGEIPPGESYTYWTVVDEYDHTATTTKVHTDCSAAIDRSMAALQLNFNDELCCGPHDRGASCIKMECEAPYCHDSCYKNWKAQQPKET